MSDYIRESAKEYSLRRQDCPLDVSTCDRTSNDVVEAYKIFQPKDCDQAHELDWTYVCALGLLQQTVDDAISGFLEYVGIQSNADRAWMIEYSGELLRFRNTHEWCRSDVEAFITELQETPTTMIGWLHRYLMAGKAVAIGDIFNLPRTARPLQVEFIRQGNKSVLSVPLFYDGHLRGIIGFDTTRSQRQWSQAEIKAMFQCANLIAHARYSSRRAHAGIEADSNSVPLIYLRKRGGVRGVLPEAIVGVSSAGNYSEIWLIDGSMVLDSRPLGIWNSIVPSALFLRIHRTAIVNASHVAEVDRSRQDRWQIKMRAIEKSWPVSRAYRPRLRERLGI